MSQCSSSSSTPNGISVLLHHHSTTTPHPQADAPAVREAVTNLVDGGLLQLSDDPERENGYETTDKGRMYVNMLCDTPWPEQRLVDPRRAATTKLRYQVGQE